MEALNSTKDQDYIYTISVQGHGSYPTDGNYKYPIKVSGDVDEATKNKYQYYAMETYQMDKFIGKLVKTLSEFDEDTILVMYGDHLPSFGLSGEDLVNGDVYQTQYVIWSNFKNDYYKNEDIEAYQLESKILGGLNMNAGDINKYTQEHKNDDSKSYQEGLKNLAYDLLYGDNYASNGRNRNRFSCGFRLCNDRNALKIGKILILLRIFLQNDGHLLIPHIRHGNLHGFFSFIVDRHAVPDTVDRIAVQLCFFRFPFDFLEFRRHAELFTHGRGKFRFEPRQLSVLHVVHGREICNSDNQLVFVFAAAAGKAARQKDGSQQQARNFCNFPFLHNHFPFPFLWSSYAPQFNALL